MNGFFVFGKDDGLVVYVYWKDEVAGSNPVFRTILSEYPN